MAIYQEEEGGTFESNSEVYDLNAILKSVAEEPIEMISVSKLKWVLEYCTPDEKRVEAADLSAPLLVTKDGGKELTVDGLHRLTRAVRENVTELPYRRVSSKVMKDAVIKPTKESLMIHVGAAPIYLNW